MLIITHYQRILHLVQPSHVHVLYQGRIVREGGPELVDGARGQGLRLDHRRGRRGRRVNGADRAPTCATSPAEFPVLRREFDGQPLAYLDSAATSQTPQPVIDAMRATTPSRAPRSTAASTRSRSRRPTCSRAPASGSRAWLGSTPQETIFTANATAAINLVAYTWGRANVGAGDLVRA